MSDEWVDAITGYKSSTNAPSDWAITGPTSEASGAQDIEETPIPDDGAPDEAPPTEPEARPEPRPEPTSTKRYADKYDSPEELERAYLETTRESSRLARERADFERRARELEEIAQSMAAQLEVQKTPPPQEWPEISDDEYLEKPLDAVKRLIEHRAQLEIQRFQHNLTSEQRRVAQRTEGLRNAFDQVFQTQNIPKDQVDSYISFVADPGVQALVDAGQYQQAARMAHLLWHQDYVPKVQAQAKEARKAAYVEGSHARAPGQSREPRPPTLEDVKQMSDEELNLRLNVPNYLKL